MENFINVGFGNSVNAEKVLAVMGADTLPAKRLIASAKDANKLLDATGGRKNKAMLVLDNGSVMLCGLHTETIRLRLNGDKNAQDD